MVRTLPKQLPKGVSLENLEVAAANLKRTMMIVFAVQIVFNRVLKSALIYLMSMLFILQLVVSIDEYSSISLPAQVEMCLTAFKSVANFESVELDKILDMLFPKVLSKNWTVEEILTG